jgi:hypothetical protein
MASQKAMESATIALFVDDGYKRRTMLSSKRGVSIGVQQIHITDHHGHSYTLGVGDEPAKRLEPTQQMWLDSTALSDEQTVAVKAMLAEWGFPAGPKRKDAMAIPLEPFCGPDAVARRDQLLSILRPEQVSAE